MEIEDNDAATWNIVRVETNGEIEMIGVEMHSNESYSCDIAVDDSTATIANSLFYRNTVTGSRVVLMRFSDAYLDMSNNILWDNEEGAIEVLDDSYADVINNVNWSSASSTPATYEDESGGSTSFINNIVAGDSSTGSASITWSGTGTFEYNDLWAASSSWGGSGSSSGTGNISQDPDFVDPSSGDFTLDSASRPKRGPRPAYGRTPCPNAAQKAGGRLWRLLHLATAPVLDGLAETWVIADLAMHRRGRSVHVLQRR